MKRRIRGRGGCLEHGMEGVRHDEEWRERGMIRREEGEEERAEEEKEEKGRMKRSKQKKQG